MCTTITGVELVRFQQNNVPTPHAPKSVKKFTILRMFTGFPWEY